MRRRTHASVADVLAGTSQWCVVQGDCLDIMRGIGDKRVVVVTDVPYCVGKDIANDNLPWDVYLPWLDDRLDECRRVGSRVYTFYSSTKLMRFIRETRVCPDYELNWHKPMILTSRAMNCTPYLTHREPILYWGPMSVAEAGKRGYDSFAYNPLRPSERVEAGIDHPTPKPTALLYRALQYWTDAEDVVLDPFAGGGSTLVAAVRLGRRVIGIDIEQRWVDDCITAIKAELAHTTAGAAKRGQGALFG